MTGTIPNQLSDRFILLLGWKFNGNGNSEGHITIDSYDWILDVDNSGYVLQNLNSLD